MEDFELTEQSGVHGALTNYLAKINTTPLALNVFGCNLTFFYSEASSGVTGRCLLVLSVF